METIFPSGKGYEGFFLVGVRKDPNGLTTIQRTGTVVLKRTYEIDPATGTLLPAEKPLPVFMRDQPDNLVVNSDFELPLFDDENNPSDWQPDDAVTISQAPDPDDDENHFLQVAGAAGGCVVQTLTFEEPLGGRQFWFSFSASADEASTRIEGVQLEADGHAICVINRDLETTMKRFSATGTWPTELGAKEMRAVLRMAVNSAHMVQYDKIQVEERGYRTVWDPATTLRYEHDLAAFKPEGDVIVLGFAEVTGLNRLRVDGITWLTRNVTSASPPQKALFGWESRLAEPRKGEAGTFPTAPEAYPLEDPLPANFSNHFYNGHRRTNGAEQITASLPSPSYLFASTQVKIERNASLDYGFALRGDTATAAYYCYDGTGSDEEGNWRSVPLTMNLDTLVIEPEKNHCYLVWRGVWPFDDHSEDAYRCLLVTGAD